MSIRRASTRSVLSPLSDSSVNWDSSLLNPRPLSLASKLPQGARLHMTLFHRPNITVLPYIPPTSLTINWHQIQSFQHLDRPQTLILGQIFQSLTLANLRELVLGYRQQPLMPEWPHEQFLALCERSAFPEGLRVLRIANFRIRERELIQILSALHALEHLELMNGDDYREYRVDPADFLATDNILRALAIPGARPDSATASFRLPRAAAVHRQCLCRLCEVAAGGACAGCLSRRDTVGQRRGFVLCAGVSRALTGTCGRQ
ncbi:hypothetical protein B0H14DRAFT_1367626 [Mycena olivaceomarginata]|nr:hypothetical protein B0H14DRAFT_1367626 [Mycena olivaceomarginata]